MQKTRSLKMIGLALVCAGQFAHATWFGSDPEVVSKIDLKRYQGVWWEVAHSHNWFQALCQTSSAKYKLLKDGRVSVLNTCYRDGAVFDTIKGVAYAPNPSEPAKLAVDFGFIFNGDYWIVALDPQYRWAVVSGSRKSSLFILSRTAPMSQKQLGSILAQLQKRGFDTSSLVYDQY